MGHEREPKPLRLAEVFSIAVTAYANLRGHLADRYGDANPEVAGWLSERGVAWVAGATEVEELTEKHTDASSAAPQRRPGSR